MTDINLERSMSWQAFDGGETVGSRGSEGGAIVADDEHADGARITLEVDCNHAPFAITCGIYGWFFHTVYASSRAEADQTYRAMRAELEGILAGIPCVDAPDVDASSRSVSEKISAFVDRFA